MKKIDLLQDWRPRQDPVEPPAAPGPPGRTSGWISIRSHFLTVFKIPTWFPLGSPVGTGWGPGGNRVGTRWEPGGNLVGTKWGLSWNRVGTKWGPRGNQVGTTRWGLSGNRVGTTWFPLGPHLVPTRFPLSPRLVPTKFPPGSHLVPTRFPPGPHPVPTGEPSGNQVGILKTHQTFNFPVEFLSVFLGFLWFSLEPPGYLKAVCPEIFGSVLGRFSTKHGLKPF